MLGTPSEDRLKDGSVGEAMYGFTMVFAFISEMDLNQSLHSGLEWNSSFGFDFGIGIPFMTGRCGLDSAMGS